MTYEGILTLLLPPVQLQLDATIWLDLVDSEVCIAGRLPARAFRPGTRLRVSHLLVLVRATFPPRVFATAITVIYVLYFSNARVSPLSWWGIQSGMNRRPLALSSIAFAEEMFDAIVSKFLQWFSLRWRLMVRRLIMALFTL